MKLTAEEIKEVKSYLSFRLDKDTLQLYQKVMRKPAETALLFKIAFQSLLGFEYKPIEEDMNKAEELLKGRFGEDIDGYEHYKEYRCHADFEARINVIMRANRGFVNQFVNNFFTHFVTAEESDAQPAWMIKVKELKKDELPKRSGKEKV